MPSKDTKKRELRVKYVIPDNIPDYNVTGVFGSISLNRLMMHFFSERSAIPKEYTAFIDDETKKVTDGEPKKGADLVRLIQTSIAMDLNTAIAIHAWMGEKIDTIIRQHEALIKEQSDEKSKE